MLRRYTGRRFSELIAKKHIYPDSSSPLPNGNVVYHFSTGSGATLVRNGAIGSNVCRVWIEVDAAGVTVGWRYENCT